MHVSICLRFSQELRELEASLKAAYMNKERAAQLAEKEAKKYDDMAKESEISRIMKEEHARAAEAERQREVEHYQENVRSVAVMQHCMWN